MSVPGSVTSPCESALRGSMSSMPWTCWPFLMKGLGVEVETSATRSETAVGLMVKVFSAKKGPAGHKTNERGNQKDTEGVCF